MAGQFDGLGLVLIAAGGLAVYAGVKGYSIPHALTAFVQGQTPAGEASYPITGTAAASPGPASPGTGGSYSSGQLQNLWIMAGGDPGKASAAACIADHESSGDPGATSPNPDGGTNVGLWQLDTPGGKGAGYSVAQLKDPTTNARLAVVGSSNGTNWSGWSTAAACGV